MSNKCLLAVIELGGYPDFRKLYEQFGYQVTIESSIRKSISLIKKNNFDVVVAEFNYQHTFRDRLSNLESIIAVAQTNEQLKFIVLYETEFKNHLDKLKQQFQFNAEISFPVNEEKMTKVLAEIDNC